MARIPGNSEYIEIALQCTFPQKMLPSFFWGRDQLAQTEWIVERATQKIKWVICWSDRLQAKKTLTFVFGNEALGKTEVGTNQGRVYD